MAPARLLERNVRPNYQHDHDDSEDEVDDADATSIDDLDEEQGDDASSTEEDGDVRERAADEEYGVGSDGEDVEQQLSNVSFSALLQAQGALSRKRKRGSDTNAEQESKLDDVRARLQEIRSQKEAAAKKSAKNKASTQFKAPVPTSRTREGVDGESEDDDSDDSDSAPSEEGAPSKSRSSKHAPMSQSSRHQVTRKRTVVNVPKRHIRDPRFDALPQQSSAGNNTSKAYDFLVDYQKSEIAELKAAAKQTRNEDDKDTLRRKAESMQNRIKARESKEREQEVLRQHRKEEQGRVKEGKKPFFLKRKDVKERALVEKFKGMKGKDREKLMARRRKKEGQKEIKRMPEARRVAG